MKVKSLGLLFLVVGCSEKFEPSFEMPDASCYEVHDSSMVVEIAGDASQTDSVPQPVDVTADTTKATD